MSDRENGLWRSNCWDDVSCREALACMELAGTCGFPADFDLPQGVGSLKALRGACSGRQAGTPGGGGLHRKAWWGFGVGKRLLAGWISGRGDQIFLSGLVPVSQGGLPCLKTWPSSFLS